MSDETLVQAALATADPVARAAYLDAACPDPDQRRRVEELIQARETTELSGGGTVAQLCPPALPRSGVLAPIPPADGALGRIAHYDLLAELGRGSFGTVFRAFDTRLHREVAVKVLSGECAADPAARTRFLRESRAVAAVHSEHVVGVFAVSGDDAPLPYLVMEYVAGESLQQRLRAGPLPISDVLRLGAQIARGLAAAHAKGLIHRDIKPGNILIEAATDRAKVADFGLARAADDSDASRSGGLVGTPQYMAPEQARCERLDHRADLFSLGGVLYAMLTGEPPFRAASTFEVLKRVVESDPRPAGELRPDAPPELCGIIAKLLAKDPAKRIPTATAVADRLDACPVAAPPSPRPNRRRALVAGALAGLALGAVGVYALSGKKPDADTATKAGPPLPQLPLPQQPPLPRQSQPKPPTAALPRPDLGEFLTSADWEWGAPKPVSGVNTADRDLCPTLTSDELVMVFARGKLGQARLYVSRRASRDEPFGKAELLPEAINSNAREAASLSGDGLLLAIASTRFDPKTGKELEGIWVSKRAPRDEPFPEPARLAAPANTPDGVAAFPILSADGLTLLATPLRPGAGNGDVAMYTRKTRDEAFDGETVLPPPVSTPGVEFDAGCWVSDDRRVLIRTRMWASPFETRFHVRETTDEPFGEAHEFVIPGLDGKEIGRPWLSPDGARLYFHSRELPGGAGNLDIWVSERKRKK